MDTVHEARRALALVEGQLRQLIERGLKEQRYGEVAEVAGLAQGVASLLQGVAAATGRASPAAVSEKSRRGTPVATNPGRRSASKAGRPYPRFEREGDKLVKVGWSKKNKSTYEHRAPREAVVAFSQHLSRTVQEGTLFVVEDLLPVPDTSNGGELPAYQVYLALAWLRHAGAVDKRGRDGYVLRKGGLADGAFDRMWAGLPARSA